MNHKWIISVNFRTKNDLDAVQVSELFMEQWEQTAAHMEGDSIEVVLVTDISEVPE